MAGKLYSPVAEVNDGVQNWRIKTRVARLWEHRDEKKGDELIRMHMVLVDEKGDGIHAFVPQGQISKFKSLLTEGRVYYFQYFECSPVAKPYRSTVHRYELRFAPWTVVTEAVDVNNAFPLHYYKLRSFKELLDNVTDKTYLADILGLVTGISSLSSVGARGKPTMKRNIRVTDGRCTAVLTLWNDKAEGVDADALIQRSQREPIVVLAMGCGFRMQDGMLQVSPSFGSKVCFDAVNADVSAFRNRVIGLDHTIESIPDRGRQLGLSETENVAVSYLASLIPHEHLNKVYRTKIIIQEIPTAQNWWFRSCDRCSSGAVEEGDAFRCSKEDCLCKTASPKYKLSVRAADGDSVVDMVFFADVATNLIGRPADELIADFLDSSSLMPPEISRLVGRRYVVEVTVSRFSLRRERIDFQVLRFSAEGGESYAEFSLPNRASGDASSTEVIANNPSSAVGTANTVGIVSTAKSQPPLIGTPDNIKTRDKGEDSNQTLLSTPPDSVLEVAENDAGEDENSAGNKTVDGQKKRRARSGGAKSSASKKLYSDEQTASKQGDGNE